MSALKGYIRYNQNCKLKCMPQSNESLNSHQEKNNIEHNYMRQIKLKGQIEKFQTQINGVTSILQSMIEKIRLETANFIKGIEDIRDNKINLIKNKISEYWSLPKQISEQKNIIMTAIQLKSFGHMNCSQMYKLISLIQATKSQKEFVKVQKVGIQTFEKQIYQKYVKQLFDIVTVIFLERKEEKQLFSVNESNISKHSQGSKQSGSFSILAQLEKEQNSVVKNLNLPASHYSMSKKKKQQLEESIFIEQDQDVQTIYSKQQKYQVQKSKQEDKMLLNKKQKQDQDIIQYDDPQTIYLAMITKEIEKESKKIINENTNNDNREIINQHSPLTQKTSFMLWESYIESEPQEEQQNQVKVQQALENFNKQMKTKEKSFIKETDPNYFTIQQLCKMNNKITTFNIRVKIVKLLIHFVIKRAIPKIKFVAGDKTGYGIFYTNFCPGMKAGIQLQMLNCKLFHFMGNLQVVNDKNFRIMEIFEPIINVNMEGTKLSRLLMDDLYYPIQHKRCLLIRQVADKLRNHQTVSITRMIVQVTMILSDWPNGIFCQVGDSSGLMLAYIKKQPLKNIHSGTNIRILKAKGGRGKQKNDFFQEEILYIDTYVEGAKVQKHKFDFLQISNQIMSAL